MKLFDLCCSTDTGAWSKACQEENITMVSFSSSHVEDPKQAEKIRKQMISSAQQETTVVMFSNRGMSDAVQGFLSTLDSLSPKLILVPIGGDALMVCTGNISSADLSKINAYLTYGGSENLHGMMKYIRFHLFGDESVEVPEPVKCPFDGIYWEDQVYQSLEEFLQSQPKAYPVYVGMLTHRSGWLSHSLQTEQEIISQLNAIDVGVVPVFSAGEKNEQVQSHDFDGIVQDYFTKDGKLFIQGIVNFQMHLIKGQQGMTIAETSVMKFQQLGIPVFHPIASYFVDEDHWKESVNPLAQELQTDYLNPEMAGMIEPVLTAVRSGDRQNYVPIKSNAAAFAGRVKKWLTLRTKPNAEKKVAIMLHNAVCSGVEATIGKSFGLDSFESIVKLMKRMKAEGYSVENVPDTGEELRQLIMEKKAFSDFRWTSVEDIIACGGCIYRMPVHNEYLGYFQEFSPAMQNKMLESWGDPPGEGMVMGDDLIITGIHFGNVTVMVQPKRGCYGSKCTGEVCRILHDPTCPPAHQYIATYRYLERVRQVDAVIHVGTEGSLEYLPGKGSGLSQECWPYAVLGSLPNIYPYHLGVLSEASIAKRRANAVLVGYYPSASSGLDSDDMILMDKLDQYAEAHRLENGQDQVMKEEILRLLRDRTSLMKLLNSADSFAEGVQLVRSSMMKCAEGRKKSSLHVLGQNPDREEAVLYLCEVLRGDGIFQRQEEENEFQFQKRIHEFVELCLEDETRQDPLSMDIRYTYSQLMETSQEQDNLISVLEGKFLPSSEGGMPDENGRNILPAGRNFYMMNMDKIPTPTAYENGRKLAEQLLASYQKDEGKYPHKIAMNMISLDISRTHGEQLSQFLYLLGVRPQWDKTGRTMGLEVIPLEELGRPRIDVTLRISGVMRDTWPAAVELMDEAVMMVSALDEGEEDNYILSNIRQMEEECGEMGKRASTIRIFGDPPGAFGAGIDLALKASAWESDQDLARYFVQSSAFAYGKGLNGRRSVREFVQNAKSVDLTCDVTSSRRMDTLACGFGLQVHGGYKLIAQTYGKKKIRQYQSTSELNTQSSTTSLADCIEKDIRQTLLNASWQDGMKQQDYTGASEIMHRIQNVFDTQCTSEILQKETLDQLAEAYVNDEAMRNWLLEKNPYAAEEIGRRFLEMNSRGKWMPDEELLEQLQENYLSIEGDMEGQTSGNGEIQGGSVEIIKDDQVENWKKDLKDIDEYLNQLQKK